MGTIFRCFGTGIIGKYIESEGYDYVELYPLIYAHHLYYKNQIMSKSEFPAFFTKIFEEIMHEEIIVKFYVKFPIAAN